MSLEENVNKLKINIIPWVGVCASYNPSPYTCEDTFIKAILCFRKVCGLPYYIPAFKRGYKLHF